MDLTKRIPPLAAFRVKLTTSGNSIDDGSNKWDIMSRYDIHYKNGIFLNN